MIAPALDAPVERFVTDVSSALLRLADHAPSVPREGFPRDAANEAFALAAAFVDADGNHTAVADDRRRGRGRGAPGRGPVAAAPSAGGAAGRAGGIGGPGRRQDRSAARRQPDHRAEPAPGPQTAGG